MKLPLFFYVFLLLGLTVYSYGFVDPNLVLSTHLLYQKLHQPLFELVFHNRPLSTIIFVSLVCLLFTFYFLLLIAFRARKSKLSLLLWLLKQKKLTKRHLLWFTTMTVGFLIFSYPAFSYDIFNYIFTAKVAFFYHENPYLVMPIEFISDPNLAFTRAANKVALYGPLWILLSIIPHLAGFGNILLTIFSFKLFITFFYLATAWLIRKLSKNLFPVLLFALNPLVLIETLVSSHNDVVMMFFALLALHLLQKKRIVLAIIMLLVSILIKYATVFLIPVFLYTMFQLIRKKKVVWERIFHLSGWSMLVVLLLSPIREELYPWYIIWILSFAVLVSKKKVFLSIALTLSFAALFRYTPVLYTGSYFGTTPLVRELVTFVPLFIVLSFWVCKAILLPKFYRL